MEIFAEIEADVAGLTDEQLARFVRLNHKPAQPGEVALGTIADPTARRLFAMAWAYDGSSTLALHAAGHEAKDAEDAKRLTVLGNRLDALGDIARGLAWFIIFEELDVWDRVGVGGGLGVRADWTLVQLPESKGAESMANSLGEVLGLLVGKRRRRESDAKPKPEEVN